MESLRGNDWLSCWPWLVDYVDATVVKCSIREKALTCS